ncbi:MAG: hypothetical protein IPN26_01755 [Bacteroidetes bacterium]|jgi:hypothetical protein|nr:hypothetical protein [Bacteroidota bacterium]
MPSPVFLAYDVGETFSSINTLTLGAGIAWGTCTLAYRTIDFSRERLDETGWFVNTPTDRDVYDQYCRLSRPLQEQLHLPRQTITKSVRGVSVGFSAGGVLDIFDNLPIRSIWDFTEETIEQAIQASNRRIAQEIVNNTVGIGSNAGGLTVGTAGGFNQMFDAGVFYGMNGHDMFSLTPELINSYDFCLVQIGVGAGVSASCNFVFLGDFRDFSHYISLDREIYERIIGVGEYIYDVINRAHAFVLIGEAQAGVILPGGSINIVAT